jgi:hypothetical protein
LQLIDGIAAISIRGPICGAAFGLMHWRADVHYDLWRLRRRARGELPYVYHCYHSSSVIFHILLRGSGC